MPKKSDLVWKFEYDVKKRSYLKRILLAIDQLFNVVFWNGSQDETISSHIGRRIASGKANWFDKALCKALRVLQSKHCIRAKGE
jgi:uncharacterized protein YlxP (DUF503 family)